MVVPGNFPFRAYILLYLKNWPRIDLILHIAQLKKASKFSIISSKQRMLKRENEEERI